MLSARTLVPWSAVYPFGGAIFSCAHILPFASGSAAKSGDTLNRLGVHTQGVDSLKSQLRALYRLVHPDLFHDAPVEKETNEVSFKALQEYLGFPPARCMPHRVLPAPTAPRDRWAGARLFQKGGPDPATARLPAPGAAGRRLQASTCPLTI